ncbi:hypothetical protein Acr_27g0001550 [Actinidia rufa]|uniref:Uncharacterized protein n=1 Tax=Actinidia rufa TaxID=165716 RepID=A0A7J0H5P0_9ERIC|nr:hypothetical protein Acr_27g0001550 [Actinidia rufa]
MSPLLVIRTLPSLVMPFGVGLPKVWLILDLSKEFVDWFLENHINPLSFPVLMIDRAIIPFSELPFAMGNQTHISFCLSDVVLQLGKYFDSGHEIASSDMLGVKNLAEIRIGGSSAGRYSPLARRNGFAIALAFQAGTGPTLPSTSTLPMWRVDFLVLFSNDYASAAWAGFINLLSTKICAILANYVCSHSIIMSQLSLPLWSNKPRFYLEVTLTVL